MSKPTPGKWTDGGCTVLTDTAMPLRIATTHYGTTDPDLITIDAAVNAKFIVASCNAIQSAAEKLGEDPIELAERLGNGHLADLIAIGEER